MIPQPHTDAPAQEREFPLTDKDFRFLTELAHAKTGIVLPDKKKDMVYGRLVRRLRALGLQSFRQYCELLQSGQGENEMPHLCNALTTNLTSFFREKHHFDHLHGLLSDMARKNPDGGKLRIWSAGCSSGMEPYSIAMTVLDAIPRLDKWDARILATDIDSNMLEKGQSGEYTRHDAKSIPESYSRFFDFCGGDGIQMSDRLQKLVSFKRLNLLESWPMKGAFDFIFCRNVAIYFDRDTKKGIFDRYASLLKPEGWLYIGHSENLHGVTDLFALAGRTSYRKTSS